MTSSIGIKTAVEFVKYSGAGNDFILIDDRAGKFPVDRPPLIRLLCDRHFGIGADGICTLSQGTQAPFLMRIFNPDGSEAPMCGNGLRCFKRFLDHLGLAGTTQSIEVSGRVLEATTTGDGQVRLGMGHPRALEMGLEVMAHERAFPVDLVDTGTPHLLHFVDDVQQVPVAVWGPSLRYHHRFAPAGVNVNFVQRLAPRKLAIRTYERGVEGETLACGTGSTAAALGASWHSKLSRGPVEVQVASGCALVIDFIWDAGGFRDVTMTGPAIRLFSGCWDLGDSVEYP